MHQFDITILGSGAALPARGRFPSAQVLNANGSLYLIDCAEGTQMRLRTLGISIQKIKAVFISHLHGDHYLGLMGLISSMHLLGREKDLKVFGPLGLKEIVEVQLRHSNTFLRFPLVIEEQAPEVRVSYEDKNVRVQRFPLKHRIDCNGYLFKEPDRERNIIPEKIEGLGLNFGDLKELKKGKDVQTENGEVVMAVDVTNAPMPSRSYAYCSDTAYLPSIVDVIKDCDLLYHEATFADDESKRAKATMHSTAREAAMIAQQAGAKKLLIGHFSSRYKDLDKLLDQARQEFENTCLAQEGEVFNIG